MYCPVLFCKPQRKCHNVFNCKLWRKVSKIPKYTKFFWASQPTTYINVLKLFNFHDLTPQIHNSRAVDIVKSNHQITEFNSIYHSSLLSWRMLCSTVIFRILSQVWNRVAPEIKVLNAKLMAVMDTIYISSQSSANPIK